MGLDTTHNAWHGPYSAFMRWRKKLAQVAGKPPLLLMEGFFERGTVGYDPLTSLAMEAGRHDGWGDYYMAEHLYDSLPIRWDSLCPDPLHELLYHSDCDGELPPESLETIAERLEQLAPEMPDDLPCVRRKSYREATLQFAAGCREAAREGVPLEFQ